MVVRMLPSVLVCVSVAALTLPAGALSSGGKPGDGSLVVQRASAPNGVAAVTLVLKGTVVGRLATGSPDLTDTVVIDELDGSGQFSANAVGGVPVQTTQPSSTRTRYVGSNFRFRAVDQNDFRVTIYGSGINIFAVGAGKVTLQGGPDPASSGRYSLDGQHFTALPAVPTAWLELSPPVNPRGRSFGLQRNGNTIGAACCRTST